MTPTARRSPEEIRAAIVGAAIEVVGDGGLGALTHRSVAAAAGVSLSSTTYHVASKAAIVEAAVRAVAAMERARAAEALADLARGSRTAGTRAALVAFLLARVAGDAGPRMRALYELQLQAVDDPALQDVVAAWFDDVARVAAEGLAVLGSPEPVLDARILVAAVDGLRLDALTTAPSAERAALLGATLERLVAVLVAGPPG